MTYAGRRAAEQMERDGISKLPRWSKPKRVGCANMQRKLDMPKCGCPGCSKTAGYNTRRGVRCYTHARKDA